MMRFAAVIALFPELPPPELRDWVARGWVRADGATPEEWVFAEIDIARIHLVVDLRLRLALAEETLPVVLGLLDQVTDLRRTLDVVTRALDEQPDPVRKAVADAIRRIA